ncbi:DoxX family protein [Plantactinospora sp. GCM10030261]|uniref:DoxX family protein n=1 Tax=Plantactinospora sp. GCM10030261 TaxID=3273420 RepID=UPI00361D2227
MTIQADPVWPVLALAALQLVDALLCVKPVGFVARCLDDVGFPRRFWRLLPPVKLAACAGLLLGLVVPYLGLATCLALVAYFAVAVTMHLRARDIGRNITNAALIGLASAAVVLCFT